MARGRMISKVISLDEKVNALSDDTARLLFTWLIPHLDCEGRMYGDALTVKSIVFPRRSISAQKVEKYLKELENFSLIARYFVNGNEFLAMQNFDKHQTGLRKSQESPSQIPPFTTESKRSNNGLAPTQVKDKVKVQEEVKEEVEGSSSSSSLNKDDAIQAYADAFGDPSEDMEKEIDFASTEFSASWVIDAIRETVSHGKTSWAYTAGILRNWRKYGKGAEVLDLKQPDPKKYINQKYGKSVQR